MKNIIVFISIIAVFLQAKAQVKENSNITLGKSFSFASRVLNESREIQIYIPTSYNDSIKKTYPVLYVLDGQDYFNSVVSFQRMLIKRAMFPEFIVVGIHTESQKRRILFEADSKRFIEFLDSEIIQFIDNNYRTRKEQEKNKSACFLVGKWLVESELRF